MMDLTAASICGITLFLIFLIHRLSKGRNETEKAKKIYNNCGSLKSHKKDDSKNFNLLPEAGIEKEPINALTTENPVELHQNQSIKNNNHPRDNGNHPVTPINQFKNSEKGLSPENHTTNDETGQLLKEATTSRISTIEDRAKSDPPTCSWDSKGDGKELYRAGTEVKAGSCPKMFSNTSDTGKQSDTHVEEVVMRKHPRKEFGYSSRRCSPGVRRATMASLDSEYLDNAFSSNSKFDVAITKHISGCSSNDRLPPSQLNSNQSSCESIRSENLSISQLYAKLINFPKVTGRSSVENAVNPVHSQIEKLDALLDQQSTPIDHTTNKIGHETMFLNTDLKHSTSKLMSTSGVVGIGGCGVKFDKDTFEKPVEVKLSCHFPKQISSSRGIVTTLEVSCVVNDDVKPLRKFTVTMATCYVKAPCFQFAALEVECCNGKGDWLPLATVPKQKDFCVEFDVETFGRYRCVAPHTEYMKLCRSLIADGFLLLDVDSNFFTIVLCVMDNLPHLKANMWLEMSSPSVYKRVLPTSTFNAEFGQGLDFVVCGKANEFDPDTFRIEKREIWKTVLFKKFEYRIPKSLDFINTISFSVTSDDCKTLLYFKSNLLTDVKNYLSEVKPVSIDSEFANQAIFTSKLDETDSECASSSAYSAFTYIRRTQSCAALEESSKTGKMSSHKKLKKFTKNIRRKFSKH